MENIKVERKGTIAWLTVDRPRALNALNTQTLLELQSALEELARDSTLRCLLFTGGGTKAFIAGADIVEMGALDEPAALRFAELGHAVADKLANFPTPVIAVVNGYALGGGTEMALACDFIIAAENAVFGQPEVDLGVIPGFGGTQRLARKVGAGRAAELIFTARRIDATEAHRIGLVVHVYPATRLRDEAEALAARIASKAPIAIRLAKRALRAGLEMDLARGNELERWAFSRCFETEDQKEGMGAFIEKRPPAFRGK